MFTSVEKTEICLTTNVFVCIYFLVAISSVVHNITRPVFESRPIKMQNLMELWALLALFLSKISDQLGDRYDWQMWVYSTLKAGNLDWTAEIFNTQDLEYFLMGVR